MGWTSSAELAVVYLHTMSLKCESNDQPLREELDKITDDYADSDKHLHDQIALIANLARKYDASISLVHEIKPCEPNFTCYQHSFFMNENWHVILGREFIQYLVETRLEEIPIADARDDDHILYISWRIEHAGKVAQGAVESKWGRAHLWRHGVFELPRRYGDSVRFFRHISKEEAIQAFHEYTK